MENSNVVIGETHERRYLLTALLLLGLGLVALALLSQNGSAAIYNYPGGHTVVPALPENYVNGDVINCGGNLIIQQNAMMTMKGTTLNMAPGGSVIWIDGTLVIQDNDNDNTTTGDRSIVQSMGPPMAFWWRVTPTGTLKIENSLIKDYIDLEVDNIAIVTISHNVIQGNMIGVVMLANSKATIDNNTFQSNSMNLQAQSTSKTIFTGNWVKNTNSNPGIQINDGDLYMQDNVIESGPGPQLYFGGSGRTLDMNNDTIRNTVGGGDNVLIQSGSPGLSVYIDDCNISKAQASGLNMQGSSNAIIRGFINDSKFLQNGQYGIYGNSINFTMDNVQSISNQYGMYLLNPIVKISNSKIRSNSNNGIYFQGPGITASTLTISKTDISKNNQAIGMYNCIGLQLDNSTINNNSVTQISMTNLFYANIYNSVISNSTLARGIRGNSITYVNITKNIISHNKHDGIYLSNTKKARITDNTISYNGYGINGYQNVQTDGTSVVLKKNTITDGYDGFYSSNNNGNTYLDIDQNTFKRHTHYGIYVNNGHANITKNTIWNSNSRQVYVQNLGSNSIFDDNDVRNGNNVGLEVQNSPIKRFNGNTFYNHSNEHAVILHDLYIELVWTKNVIDKSRNGMDYMDSSGGNFGMILNNNTFSNISNTDSAIYSETYFTDSNISIQDNKVINNGRGLKFNHWGNTRSMLIRRNTFDNNTNDWAFYWEGQGYPTGYLDISKNTVKNKNAAGIYVSYSNKVDIRNNVITDSGTGIYTPCASGPLNVTDNVGHGNNGDVIYTYACNNAYQYPANVQRNNLSDNPDSYGIEIYSYGKLLFEDNILNNNNVGAYIDGRSLISRNNQYINNSDAGAYMYGFWEDVHIYNETMDDNRYYGLEIWDIYEDAKVLIENSTFKGNGEEGLYIEDFYDDSTLEIRNCIIDGGQYPLYLYWMDGGEVRIHDNLIANATYAGIEADYMESSKLFIYDNHFFLNTEHIYIYRGDTVIERNLFERGRSGIYAEGYHQLFILRNNTFKGVGEYNVYFYYSNPTAGSGIYDNSFVNFGVGLYFEDYGNDLPIFNNQFSQGLTGIELYGIKPNIHDNTFKMVSIGIDSYYSYSTIRDNSFKNCWEHCIGIWSDKGSVIEGNDFTYSSEGIYIESSLATVKDNTFSLNTYGIRAYSSFGTIQSNKFTDNKYGIYVESFSFVSIIDGYFSDNTEYGIWSEVNTYSTLEVTGTTTIINDKVLLNGDINVRSFGTLKLTGATFEIRSVGSGGYSIGIESGGSLVATKTTFQPENFTRPYGIRAEAGSTLNLNDCDVIGMGSGIGTRSAIYIATDDVILEKVRIKDSPDLALYIEGQVSLAMRNGTISGSKGYDVFIQNASTLRMGNTDFTIKNVKVLDTSEIIIERIISLTALDDADMPYPGVSVSVLDDQGNDIQGTTDSEGLWFRFFEGAIISSTGTTDTKITYKISISDGTQTFNNTVILSDDFVKSYRFGTAPVVLNGLKDLVTDEDIPIDLDLTKYFFDNDRLTYSTIGNVSTMYTFDGNMARLTPTKDWNGHEDVTLVATDTHGLTAKYVISITVRPVNDAPTITGVPNLLLKEDQAFRLDLLPFIYDPDTPQSGLTVTVDSLYARVDKTTVTFMYPTPMIQWVRITVKDAQGGSSQDILVTVTEVNDPPQIKGVPMQEAIERVEITVDFKQWLSDEDNNVTTLTMSSTSQFVIGANGTKLTFLFPNGPNQRFVPVTVSDGQANTTYLVEFFVTPVNDAPKLALLPAITVTEDQDYVFDLTPYVSDVDTNISKLIITTTSSYIRIDGLNLIIHIPDSGSMMTVTVTVSDSFLSASGPLRIVIIPVNDAPVLINPKGPKDGTLGSDFKFQVTFKDPDAVNPAVFVVIDGKKYVMSKVSGDFKNGTLYEINLKNVLSSGSHNYHFEAEDGSGEPNGQARTEETFGLDVAQQQSMWWIMVLVIIIIVVVAVVLLMRRGKETPEDVKMDEEPEEEEEEKVADKDEEEEEKVADKDEEEEAPEEEPEEEAEEVEEVEEEAPRKTKKAGRVK